MKNGVIVLGVLVFIFVAVNICDACERKRSSLGRLAHETAITCMYKENVMTNKEMGVKLENNLERLEINLFYLKKYLQAKSPDEPLPSYFEHIKQVMDFMDKDIQELKGESNESL